MTNQTIIDHITTYLTKKYQIEKAFALTQAQIWVEQQEAKHEQRPAPKAKISISMNLDEGRIKIVATKQVTDEGHVLLETFLMDRKIKGAWRVSTTRAFEDQVEYSCVRYSMKAKPKISQKTISKKVENLGTKEQLALLNQLQAMLAANMKAK